MLTEWKRRERAKLESGQAIIIIALVMIALLAITGLAIDGGGLLFLHRDTQNAADAALLAATYAKCVNANNAAVTAAALDAAKKNGFENDAADDWVQVNIPPTSGDPAFQTADYVEVVITAEKEKYFIGLVYPDALMVTSRAIGRCTPDVPAAIYKTALFATSTTCVNSLRIGGSSLNVIGGIQSNHDIQSQGSDHNLDGGAGYVTGIDANNITYTNGGATQQPAVSTPPLFRISDFAPGSQRAKAAQVDGSYFAYIQGTGVVSDQAGLNPKLNGPKVTLDGNIRGLIYVQGRDVELTGVLTGPLTVVSDSNISVVNMSGQVLNPYTDKLTLFTSANGGCATNIGIDMSGSSNSFNGIIYAPNANVQLSGASNGNEIKGAVIAATVDVSGSSNRFVFDPSMIPAIPPNIQIAE